MKTDGVRRLNLSFFYVEFFESFEDDEFSDHLIQFIHVAAKDEREFEAFAFEVKAFDVLAALVFLEYGIL